MWSEVGVVALAGIAFEKIMPGTESYSGRSYKPQTQFATLLILPTNQNSATLHCSSTYYYYYLRCNPIRGSVEAGLK